MPITLDEIVEHEERLQREIVERQCLLAAFNVLHGYAANGQGAKLMELGSLASELASPTPNISSLSPVPAALPQPAPEPPCMHPDLRKIALHGTGTMIVRWAIEHMTEDYSGRDISALLKREGYRMNGSEISVVLTRLKRRGEIEEIKCGTGPIPSVFRKPESATLPEMESNGQTSETETATASALAA